MNFDRIKNIVDHGYDMIVLSLLERVTSVTFVCRRSPGDLPRLRIFCPQRADERKMYAELNKLDGWDIRFADDGFRAYKRMTGLCFPHPRLARQIITSHIQTDVETSDTLPPPETERSAEAATPRPIPGPPRRRRVFNAPRFPQIPSLPCTAVSQPCHQETRHVRLLLRRSR